MSMAILVMAVEYLILLWQQIHLVNRVIPRQENNDVVAWKWESWCKNCFPFEAASLLAVCCLQPGYNVVEALEHIEQVCAQVLLPCLRSAVFMYILRSARQVSLHHVILQRIAEEMNYFPHLCSHPTDIICHLGTVQWNSMELPLTVLRRNWRWYQMSPIGLC